jgi:hypothetical protein
MKKRLISKILAIICILVVGLSTALAAGSGSVTLTVMCKSTDGTKAISGMKLSAYKVGTKDAYGNYTLKSAYSTVKTPTSKTTTSELNSIVTDIAKIISAGGVSSDYTAKSGSDGSAEFDNIAGGIYVIIGETTTCNGYIYTMNPLFVEVTSVKSSKTTVDISAVAKVSEKAVQPTTTTKPTATPTAKPTATPTAKPTATPTTKPTSTPTDTPVPTNTSAPGVPTSTPTNTPIPTDVPEATPTESPAPSEMPEATPTESPAPSEIPEATPTESPVPSEVPDVTPTDTPVPSDEPVPTGTPSATPTPDLNDSTASGNGQLTPGISQDDSTLTGENQPTPTPTEVEAKLPQTGQLWWPVPILFAAGVILIGLGIRLSKKDN